MARPGFFTKPLPKNGFVIQCPEMRAIFPGSPILDLTTMNSKDSPMSRRLVVLFLSVLMGMALPVVLWAEPDENRTVRLGFTPSILPQGERNDVKIAMKSWTEMVGKEEGIIFKSVVEFYDTLPAALRAFEIGQVDILTLNANEGIALLDSQPVDDGYVGVWNNRSVDPVLLLVHADGPIKGLRDLKNTSFLWDSGGGMGDLPWMWLDIQLLKEKLPVMNRFFLKVKEVEKVQPAVMAVFFKQAEACLVRETPFKTMCELNPQLGKQLRVLMASPPLSRGLTFFRPDLKIRDFKRFKASVVRLHLSNRGRQVLNLFKADRLATFTPDLLGTARTILQEHQQLLKQERP
jgi:ABC-type phosphate/phosphonate transport system substrate-binding protein